MNRKLILTLLIVALGGSAFGQILKYRIGANYGKFNKEIGKEEVEHPLIQVLSNPNSTEFTHAFEPGFEAEIMQLWSPNVETGIELNFSKFSGSNDVPPYYNYYFAPENPSVITTTEPLMYESSAMNLKLNLRYFFVPDGSVSPFFKAFAGVSFVGAEFNYEDQSVWEEGEAGILYAIGTENSDDPKELAMCYGAGAGISFKLNDQVSLYLDGTANIIGTDKLDGIPNYDYINNGGQETLKPVGSSSLFTQVSLGIVFTSKTNLGLNKNWGKDKKGSGVKRTGRTTPWRPFYRQKR
jgi:hypothetical protein